MGLPEIFRLLLLLRFVVLLKLVLRESHFRERRVFYRKKMGAEFFCHIYRKIKENGEVADGEYSFYFYLGLVICFIL